MDSYEQIPGWFDFAEVYDRAVDRAPHGAVFVEVGAYLGRSTMYLASSIQRSNKHVRLYVVDRWDGSVYEDASESTTSGQSSDLFWRFIRNVRRAGVEDVVYPLRMESERAAELFEDGTIDFVFLDADHDYATVRRDLQCWFPKIKRRGILGGHDYLHAAYPGVRRAADEFFAAHELPVQVLGTSFLVTKSSQRRLNAAPRGHRHLPQVQ